VIPVTHNDVTWFTKDFTKEQVLSIGGGGGGDNTSQDAAGLDFIMRYRSVIRPLENRTKMVYNSSDYNLLAHVAYLRHGTKQTSKMESRLDCVNYYNSNHPFHLVLIK
jgi:ketosteroid isomerase-like protein